MEELIIFILIIILPLMADIYVKLNYKKYLKDENSRKLSGQEVARMILDTHGLQNVYVVETGGYLSDHYDPKRKVVRLSKEVYEGTSVSSMAIAAHECGHAIQDKEGYAYMRFRAMIFPLVNIATSVSYWIIVLGFVLEMFDLVYLGIGLTSLGLIFQIVTLPVEFNASARAKDEINNLNLAPEDEQVGIKNVLTSAALTYIAGVLASALQIIRLILVANNNNRN